MKGLSMQTWVPTPTFLYRNYLYEKMLDNVSKNKRFLLIGTGNGYFIDILKKKGFKGNCIDISSESIELSKQLVGNVEGIEIKRADLFKYKTTKKFDLILCFEVIEHIKDDELALNRISKLLNKKGKFLMSVPAHMAEWGRIDEIGGHYRRYERKELEHKLKSSGFKIKILWCYGFPFLNVVRQISKSGSFVKNKSSKKVDERIKKSGIRTEYDKRLKPIVTNPIILFVIFKIMDLFLDSDLGIGYIVELTKA